MLDQTNKYENNAHFFLNPGEKLKMKSSEVPDLPGVYYVFRLAGGGIDLVYIGSSGAANQKDTLKSHFLRGKLNNPENGMQIQQFFEEKMREEKADALDIYWFVTYDENHQDLPEDIEEILLQQYAEIYGTLPPWNK